MRSGVWWVTVLMAAAPGIAAADPQPETITGSGIVLATTYSISVSGGPYGQSPTGSLDLSGAYNFDATATCMSNGGQDGVAGFRIDDGPNAGEGFLTESASPGSPVDPGDGQYVLWSGVLPVPPTVCPPPGSPEPSFLFSAGGGGVAGNLVHSGGPVDPIPMQDQEFGTPSGAAPQEIAQSPGGTLWFTQPAADRIGSIADDQSGDMQEYALPTGSAPTSIAPDLSGTCSSSGCSDAGMWFTEPATDRIGHISASGTTRTYAAPTGADPRAIGGDVNGGAWFTEPGDDGIGYISESGQVSSYRLPTPGARPAAISADTGATGAAGDGAWFTQAGADSIGYVDAAGQITEYPLPSGSGDPGEIVTDGGSPAGAWFTQTGAATIGHIDAGGRSPRIRCPPGTPILRAWPRGSGRAATTAVHGSLSRRWDTWGTSRPTVRCRSSRCPATAPARLRSLPCSACRRPTATPALRDCGGRIRPPAASAWPGSRWAPPLSWPAPRRPSRRAEPNSQQRSRLWSAAPR